MAEFLNQKTPPESKTQDDRALDGRKSQISPSSDQLTDWNFLLGILDNMDALVVVLNQNGKIIFINRACERLFGYCDQIMREKLSTGVLRLPGQIGILDNLSQFVKEKHPYQHYETDWVDNDSVQRTIAWTINSFSDKHDPMRYILASGIDITARKKAEILLQKEQILLNSLINSIPDLIFYKDLNGRYQGINRIYEKIYKVEAKKIIGLTDNEINASDHPFRYKEIDRLVLETGQTFTYDRWMKDEDGEPILIETRITPYYDSRGNALGVIGIGRDITRHHHVEEQLRAAKSEIEQIINSLSSMMFVVNLELTVTQWNPKAQELLVIPAKQAIGKKLGELPLTWDWRQIQIGLEKCRSENKPVHLDPMRFKRSNGQEGFLGVSISPLQNEQAQLVGFIFLCSDITDRRALEAQLAQAQKLESIGRLAAGIAHEVNTPIQYVGDNILFLQEKCQLIFKLLQKYKACLSSVQGEASHALVNELEALEGELDLDYLSEEIPLSIQQSLEGVKRVTDIVRAMKEFSHPGVKEKVPVDLNKALKDTLTVTRNQWKMVAEIETDLSPELPKVLCQPAEINQVFLNIIINAAQAIETAIQRGKPSPGKIKISTRLDDGWVEIRISDTGPGIPEEFQQHIFEPFFTTKDIGKGTGQGLALSYDIVKRKHNGVLTFETEINIGTTFIIKLPIK